MQVREDRWLDDVNKVMEDYQRVAIRRKRSAVWIVYMSFFGPPLFLDLSSVESNCQQRLYPKIYPLPAKLGGVSRVGGILGGDLRFFSLFFWGGGCVP